MNETQDEPTGSPDGARDSRRIEWESNHFKISEVVDSFITTVKRMPSYAEMVEKTGLSMATVKRHIRQLKTEPDRFEKFRAMTDSVVIGMARAGKHGDAKAAKLFLQFVEGWVEEKKVNQVNVNPYAALTDDDLKKKLADRLAKMKPKATDAPPAA